MRRTEDRIGSASPSFTENLEEKARQLPQSERPGRSQWSPGWRIKDEVALVLDQIDSLRANEEEVLEELLDTECRIGTELFQMEQRTPRYSLYRFPEREKHLRRLDRVASERRRFKVSQTEKLAVLHERLLGLLGKWTHLKPPGRDRLDRV